MEYFDAHLHLTDAAFSEDRADALTRARAAGVCGMVTVASNPADAEAALELANGHPDVWATAGLHPHEARTWTPELMARIRDLTTEPRLVAVGETGLDFHYDTSERAAQAAAFDAHLDLAAQTGLPAIVHSRAADEETAGFIRRYMGRARGILHCFGGGAELMDTGLDAGWFVSFAGIVTFRTYEGAELVRRVPRDRLLIETDSPYLAPVPRRGRRNEPAFVTHTCAVVAELRDEAPEAVARSTLDNARSVYGLRVVA